jgi:uncharacterized protein
MLLDANVLIYAVSAASPHNESARNWLTEALNGAERIALPWQTIGAFVRITTSSRINEYPLTPEASWSFVSEWLDHELTWIPPTGTLTATIFGQLLAETSPSGNMITDAQLAAVAIEHGIAVVSADSDFARFTRVRWINPFAA